MLNFAIGGAAVSGFANVYRYNRDAWMTDVQVTQNRRLQKQNVLLSQVDMFRQDIRDHTGAFSQKQGSYIVVVTLIIGMMGECYVEGPMPDDAFEYVKTLYHLCVGGSLLCLVLSLTCAIGAGVLAATCQQEMLTSVVRLPIKDIAEELDETAFDDSVDAFEQQHWSRVFRMPGSGRMKQSVTPKSPARSEQSRTSAAAQQPGPRRAVVGGLLTPIGTSAGAGPSPSALRRANSMPPVLRKYASGEDDSSPMSEATNFTGPAQGTNGVQAMDEWRHMYLRAFRAREREWETVMGFASIFSMMGVGNLLQAYGYYSVSRYWTGSRVSSWIVQMLVVIVHAIMALAFRASQRNACRTVTLVFEVAMVLMPHLTCLVSIWCADEWVDDICIPMTFLCHLVSSVIGWHQLWTSAQGSVKDDKGNVLWAKRLSLAGCSIVTLFWLFCFVWAMGDCFSDSVFIAPLENTDRRLRGAASTWSASQPSTAVGMPGLELAGALAKHGLSDAADAGIAAALASLGVRQPEDLKWIHEADLLGAGLTVVQSRKLLSV